MLRSASELNGYHLNAIDDTIGKCKDFLFDETSWGLRYMVADTGNWLVGRRVLISPISLDPPDWAAHLFPVKLTKKQIEGAPDLKEDEPVSRQYEQKFFYHYNWPFYWEGGELWGSGVHPGLLYQSAPNEVSDLEPHGDEHLRSINEIIGYNIQAENGEIGHVDDFIFDDETWVIRYLVVDTRNWLPGKQVLVSPDWITDIEFSSQKVFVSITKEQVENCPEYDPSAAINRATEEHLYDYYGRPKYWI